MNDSVANVLPFAVGARHGPAGMLHVERWKSTSTFGIA